MARSEEAIKRRKQEGKAREREVLTLARDVGPVPDLTPEAKARRDSCERDLKKFLVTYLSARFDRPFGPDHDEVIADLQAVVIDGGQFALGMPRGSGKTSLMLGASLWATLYGHRKFLVLLAATEAHASRMLASIRTQIETNPLLLSDFPEVCYFVRKLGRQVTKAAGQTSLGQATRIAWGKTEVSFPYVAGSRCSATRVEVYGMTGAVRGTVHETPDGRSIRPDLLLIDDAQSDKSAKSVAMTRERKEIIEAAALGLAGPGVKIAALMACTVIERGDLSSHFLNREVTPDWQGRKYKMLVSMPSNLKLWDEYRALRHSSLKNGLGLKPATEFYAAHRVEMDEGAKVSWESRYNPDELSGIQHAMNLLYRNEAAFYAEYQNEPLARQDDGIVRQLDADEIIRRTSGVPQYLVPLEATRLTAFIDVQDESLWYCLCAWDEHFSGSVIDYGAWPRQDRLYFRAGDMNPTLTQSYKGSREARWHAALKDLTDYLLGRSWSRHDKDEELKVDKCLVDANYGQSSETIYKFIRTSGYAGILVPSHGRGVTASEKPIDSWSDMIGTRKGMGWRLMPPGGQRRQRHIIYDVNTWKSFIAERLQVPVGDRGSITLYGQRPSIHQLFADHCVAERCTATFRADNQQRVDSWKLQPNKPDNHWWDCLTGCAVAASLSGLHWSAERAAGMGLPVRSAASPLRPVVLPGQTPAPVPPVQTTPKETAPRGKRRVGLSELVDRARSKSRLGSPTR